MIDSALKIMLFMWSVSFSVLGGQYVAADMIGLELVNFNNEPIRSHLVTFLNQAEINETTENIITADYTNNSTFYDKIETSTTSAAFIAWEMITLLTGTYIFNFLFVMGFPAYFIAILVFFYSIVLARAILGYIRGV